MPSAPEQAYRRDMTDSWRPVVAALATPRAPRNRTPTGSDYTRAHA